MEDVQELKRQNDILWEQNKKLRRRIFELRRKTGYQVYEENMRLQQEIERLEGDSEKAYDILANVRNMLLDLVNPKGNQCGDMIACTVSDPACIECLAKQIIKQFGKENEQLKAGAPV